MKTSEFFIELVHALFQIIVIPLILIFAILGLAFAITINNKTSTVRYIISSYTNCSVDQIEVTRQESDDNDTDSYLIYDCNRDSHRIDFSKSVVTMTSWITANEQEKENQSTED